MPRLQNKTALITGAARGIGAAIASAIMLIAGSRVAGLTTPCSIS